MGTTEKSMAVEFHKELERRQRKIDEDREFQRYTRHHDSWIIRDLSFRRAFQKRREKLEQEQEEEQQQQQQQQQQGASSNNIDGKNTNNLDNVGNDNDDNIDIVVDNDSIDYDVLWLKRDFRRNYLQ